jgi:heterodisulfide reductase subunit A-like polyferredoxin
MPTRSEFYGDLALWSTLAVGKNQRNDVKRKIWQRFLDDLCYLCDTECGGRTTVSIAVSESQRGQCFWISANGKLQKAVDQLKLILKELDSIQENQNTNLEEVKDKVLVAGIGRSSMKVRNYLRELRRYIELMERRSPLGKGEQTLSLSLTLLTQ